MRSDLRPLLRLFDTAPRDPATNRPNAGRQPVPDRRSAQAPRPTRPKKPSKGSARPRACTRDQLRERDTSQGQDPVRHDQQGRAAPQPKNVAEVAGKHTMFALFSHAQSMRGGPPHVCGGGCVPLHYDPVCIFCRDGASYGVWRPDRRCGDHRLRHYARAPLDGQPDNITVSSFEDYSAKLNAPFVADPRRAARLRS